MSHWKWVHRLVCSGHDPHLYLPSPRRAVAGPAAAAGRMSIARRRK